MSTSDKESGGIEPGSGGDENIPAELKKEHEMVVKAVTLLAEEELRNNLESIHSKMNTQTFGGKRLFWMSGIAATLIGGIFWWNSFSGTPADYELKIDEVPAYADSASYDSLKKSKAGVDKIEE